MSVLNQQFLFASAALNCRGSIKKQFPVKSGMKAIWPVLLVLWLMVAPAALQAQFDYTLNSDGVSVTITEYTGNPGAQVSMLF
jgi:hypothetical protein